MSERKIDIYNHVMPRGVADRIRELAPGKGDMIKRVTSIPMLHDIEARIRMMDQWPGYQQVLTLSNPPIETIAGPAETPELARVANDELNRICETRPDKFPAWVASLPLNNVEASLEEIDRAIALGARGIQIFTNVNGRALDDSEFLPVFEHATSHHKVPIWMHPARDARAADYPGEAKSKYEIWQVLGWPYETSVAMARLVFSGMFDRLPSQPSAPAVLKLAKRLLESDQTDPHPHGSAGHRDTARLFPTTLRAADARRVSGRPGSGPWCPSPIARSRLEGRRGPPRRPGSPPKPRSRAPRGSRSWRPRATSS